MKTITEIDVLIDEVVAVIPGEPSEDRTERMSRRGVELHSHMDRIRQDIARRRERGETIDIGEKAEVVRVARRLLLEVFEMTEDDIGAPPPPLES